MYIVLITYALVGGIIFLPQSVSAQFNQLLPTSINLDILPENPSANQNVSASLSSFDTDLNAATITWQVNGKTIQSGKGIKKASFKTGNINTSTKIDIQIVTQQGEKITKSYSIKPTEVDLLWQADGYTPPFYKGKTMFVHQNKITFIAIPHILNSSGKEISPTNLIYKWTRNGVVMEDSSGYGKNTFTMTGSLISRQLDVTVDVTSPDTGAVGFAETLVTPRDPEIYLYEKSPLYGVLFEKALTQTVQLTGKEMGVVAVPLFFGTTYAENPSLSYNWGINGSVVGTDTHTASRIFRQQEGTVGTSHISVSIEHASKILQSMNTGFDLMFGTQTKQTTQ